ncbi:hypothetical protein AVEN_60265-1 [Araneus ventricosus]|uniref:Uncharacterized protein n=1 Tax=Araneus ventricosus TaxID=182803 RepID=A0A4Y2CZT7_ARAVE|nr:hypothetical protein AVEN_60265-1 [Araneus ventricosus]
MMFISSPKFIKENFTGNPCVWDSDKSQEKFTKENFTGGPCVWDSDKSQEKLTKENFNGSPCKFTLSDDEDDASAVNLSFPSFRITSAGGPWTDDVRFSVYQAHVHGESSGIGFRIWNPTAPKPRPYYWASKALINRIV